MRCKRHCFIATKTDLQTDCSPTTLSLFLAIREIQIPEANIVVAGKFPNPHNKCT